MTRLGKLSTEIKRFAAYLVSLFFRSLAAVGAFTAFAGVMLVAYQVFMWMKIGLWNTHTLSTVLIQFRRSLPPQFLGWLGSPHDWKGLHKIAMFVVNRIPLSIVLILTGLVVSLASSIF